MKGFLRLLGFMLASTAVIALTAYSLHFVWSAPGLLLAVPFVLLLAAVTDKRDVDASRLDGLEKHCHVVAESAKVFIQLCTPEGVIVYINSYGVEVGGWTKEEAIGRSIFDLYIPESDRNGVRASLKQVLAGEPLLGYLGPMLTKKGQVRDMVWSSARLLDENGDPCGFVASGLDVTDLRKTEKALRESEEKYRTLVDHSLAGVFIVQGNKFVYGNRRAEEIIGYTYEEARQMNFWELVHPRDQQLVKARAMRRMRGEAQPERYEYLMRTKEGKSRVAELWATLISYEGRPAVLCNVIDITERREAEDIRLQAERDLASHKRDVYRQVIAEVTQGKLDVVEPEEIVFVLEEATIVREIVQPADISEARHLISDYASCRGLAGRRLADFMLAVGEAGTNCFKHAGSGTISVGTRDGIVWVAIADHGPGMEPSILTQAVFRKGFSTKPSLGLGYTFILDGSDRVRLATSPIGTIVVLEKTISQSESSLEEYSAATGAW